MIRVNIHLPEPILAKLRNIAKKKDTSVAELIRSQMNVYLKCVEFLPRKDNRA